ncbi:WD40 repeat-like protein [Rozella allomycis CSF55]|uniref:WD40 repeat-like protein n=1 Tax=Rozella allomycis (strain CSF55) TaxID=988480 RepID=A0A4P9YFG0_ROZAC|nr:WD40 repeat-like protein [Rozella allomycis CSF55]
MTLTNFKPKHDDLIHDISFDYYCRRIATCSSDQKVKVFDYDDSLNEWILNHEWHVNSLFGFHRKAHDSSVLKIKWADPEFGNVIATSSLDRTVRIWEENQNSNNLWIERARLVDSRGAIQDIAFSPAHLGFKIATCSTDGFVRIYEAIDPMNASHWTLMDEIEICTTQREIDGQFCVSWCDNKFLPQMIVVGCGKEYTAKIFCYSSEGRKWQIMGTLEGHEDFVLDVKWAPNFGRSYELIATACKDHYVRIYRLDFGEKETEILLYDDRNEAKNLENQNPCVSLVSKFKDHAAAVWRVSWNTVGTILSTSGDDNKIRTWKSNS